MKILWHGIPAMLPTGYGNQTDLWTRELLAHGHDVVISNLAACIPTYVDRNGITNLSPGQRLSARGNALVDQHVTREKPDVVISCADTFVFDLEKFGRMPWVAWCVVDSDPLLPQLHKPCKTAKINLAMSKFGQRVMAAAGYESQYVPLAIDKDTWYPENYRGAREWVADTMHVPLGKDTFFVVMNAANMSKPSRKNFGTAFKAFVEFQKSHPDAVMYCHTESTGRMHNGEDLNAAVEQYGLGDGQFGFAPQYEYNTGKIPQAALRMIYSAADVFLHTARGEGFGLPFIEAQACGCPVIAPAFSTGGELVHHGTLLVNYRRWMYEPGTEQCIVSHSETVKALACHAEIRRRNQADAWARETFDIHAVYENHMAPLLDDIEANGLPDNTGEQA